MEHIIFITSLYIVANATDYIARKYTNEGVLPLFLAVSCVSLALGVVGYCIAKLFHLITGVYAYAGIIIDRCMMTTGLFCSLAILIVIHQFVRALKGKEVTL